MGLFLFQIQPIYFYRSFDFVELYFDCFLKELFPAIRYIFLVTGSASLRPQPKRMPLLSGLGLCASFQYSSNARSQTFKVFKTLKV